MTDTSLVNELKAASPQISVGILTANLMSLGSELELIENAGVKMVHFDTMDGCFCPMTTIGPPLIKAVKTSMLKDVHLMIENPLDKLEDYVAAGADMITVHVESDRYIHRALQVLGQMTNVNDAKRGILRGVALNPGTPVDIIAPLIDELEMVFLLAINPGWGGQKFIPFTRNKLARLREIIENSGKDVLIGLDGGVTRNNISEIAGIGADIIVTGSAVFDGKAPAENAKFMLEAVSIHSDIKRKYYYEKK